MLRLLLISVLVVAAWIVSPDPQRPWLAWVLFGLCFLPSLISNIMQIKVRAWLDAWAVAQGLRLTSYELAILRKGPFTWTTGDAQRVLRVTAKDADGRIYRGWVCVGSWLLGLLSRRIRVVWDETPPLRS